MTTEQLKNCPFCNGEGDEKAVSYTKGDDTKTVYHEPGCTECNASTESVARWQERPIEDQLKEQIKQLRKALQMGLEFHADVMPNIGKMTLQNYQVMNEFPIEASKALKESAND